MPQPVLQAVATIEKFLSDCSFLCVFIASQATDGISISCDLNELCTEPPHVAGCRFLIIRGWTASETFETSFVPHGWQHWRLPGVIRCCVLAASSLTINAKLSTEKQTECSEFQSAPQAREMNAEGPGESYVEFPSGERPGAGHMILLSKLLAPSSSVNESWNAGLHVA